MIYILCTLIIAAGLVLAWFLKREGEKSYARHLEMVRQQQQRDALIRMRITLQDNFTPKMRALGIEMEKMRVAFTRVGEAFSKSLGDISRDSS